MATPRILLDTNVWDSIVENDGVEPLRRAARRRNVQILACPAVAYELLRVSDPAKRRRRAKAIAREDWPRLMPEAFSEAEDLRLELERLRPDWFLGAPNLNLWHRHRADWQGGFWRRGRSDPDTVARHIGILSDDLLEQARESSKVVRDTAREVGHTAHTFKWNRAEAVFAMPTPGWDGAPFEAWRGQSVSHWWDGLLEGGSETIRDWLAPWLDLPAIRADQASWTRLWTREVSARALPREWVRWAMAEAQATRAWSRGTPGDNQISTYLVEVDFAISTDKVFADIAGEMRRHAPVALAEVERSPTGADALDFVVDFVHEIA